APLLSLRRLPAWRHWPTLPASPASARVAPWWSFSAAVSAVPVPRGDWAASTLAETCGIWQADGRTINLKVYEWAIRQSRRGAALAVKVGNATMGGGAPVAVQSMPNTDTADVQATASQVAELARAGSELVRVTVDRSEAAAAVPHIRDALGRMGLAVPLIGDF